MTLDRSKSPEFQIPEDISLQNPIKRTLNNGVHLYFIPTPDIDAIRLEINTDTQRSLDLVDKKLTSFFTLNMIMEGTKNLSASELDDFFDHYASEVEVSSGFENNSIALLTTKKHFSEVIPVFRTLLTEATFPEKELAKRKSQKALSISLQKEQNAARASQLFRSQLFGENHPYGLISDEYDVQIIEREDLVEYYENSLWYNPEIFLTGNVDEVELNMIADALGSLKVNFTEREFPAFNNIQKNRLYEEKEKSLQSTIRIGCHLIPKNHPDYQALSVFNTILGGYFGSRLIKNIREEKGHTYGIYSSIGSLKNADYWVVMADVQKQYLNEVITEIYKEINLLKTELVEKNELETVRNYMIGNFLSNFSSAFDLIGRFKSIHQAGLDQSFYEEKLDFIRTFTAQDILEVAQKYFNKSDMVEVIVG
ncbi:putative Zn-dependent peptidase [Belliella baltica DSM 15883]|uniref:Putative Zn-dependent peptidase n=1 Tax=Belliella baltica (strain DSM 15883 / CIP 108006 / LMG 21964 / BA134) TaxID=866536 RepID=I3Z0M9_BELBD|nr:pitrilysin family protein [Belliella baltica]AFL82797.1 putative Zn-dependent peptidase [Belliella baltica DSM 15883]